MALDEKTTFGATIEPTSPPTNPSTALFPNNNGLSTPTQLTPAVTRDSANNNPFDTPHGDSPSAGLALPTKTHLDIFEHDLESGAATPLAPSPLASNSHLDLPFAYTTRSNLGSYSIDGRPKECTMWPSKTTLREKALAEKQARRGRGLGRVGVVWARLDKRTKLWIKICIALFIVAAAVGLGIGISKVVGGGIWAGNGSQKTLPSNV